MVTGLPRVLISLMSIIAGALGLWAAFLITTPEPAIALTEDPMTLRKLVRVCAILSFCGSILKEAGDTGNWGVVVVVAGGILAFVGIISHFGFFVYLRRFAQRIPDESLAAQTRVVMWGFLVPLACIAALGVVAVTLRGGGTIRGVPGTGAATATAATQPGPLASMSLGLFGCGGAVTLAVFGIWYIVLLFRYHGIFREAVRLGRQAGYDDRIAMTRPIEPPTPKDGDRS